MQRRLPVWNVDFIFHFMGQTEVNLRVCDELTSTHDYLATTWRCKLMSLDKYIISK